MCKRSKPDPLAAVFLRHYRMNLLMPPGNRVKCGSVYIKQGRSFTAPGELASLVEPVLELPKPYVETNLADVHGTWSAAIGLKAGVGLLEGFLTALGAAGLITKLRAGAERTRAQTISFRFADARRESISPTQLADALAGHRFRAENSWVREGNRYYVAGAVMRAASISVRAHDEREHSVDLGGEVAAVGSADASVSVERGEDNSLTYEGKQRIGFAVELYELLWDAKRGRLAFDTTDGPIELRGFSSTDRPVSVFVGEDDEAIVQLAT